jgi:single-strand DNA-binding protein
MPAYNRTTIVGNITSEVDVTHTASGTAVANISIAINDKRKNQAGDLVETVDFIPVTLWGRTAEVAAEYLGKGSPVLIDGRLKVESWEQDGVTRQKMIVVANKLEMLGGKKKAAKPSANGDANGQAAAELATSSVVDTTIDSSDGDIPF